MLSAIGKRYHFGQQTEDNQLNSDDHQHSPDYQKRSIAEPLLEEDSGQDQISVYRAAESGERESEHSEKVKGLVCVPGHQYDGEEAEETAEHSSEAVPGLSVHS